MMAYLDLRDTAATVTPLFGASRAPAVATAADARFARTEWQVIVLAERDGLASLSPPSRLSRLFARLFGGGHNPRLADGRLEALRRLAVQAWHYGYAVPVSSIKSFLEAGFSSDQLELLLASIANGRIERRSRRAL
ncbi:hypothetical protein [Sphingomonas morindae]|uniref:Uncharacterized protein n=1 Tax=Sphingomonas morindae TaxID=1541170 RepID=A0ABY4X7P1_9SPHN|nr:hypothetical protein [Sphingomonas morindae]USI72953.1 hypothetical protein LHA26_00260 [Sphingomonas morindae]